MKVLWFSNAGWVGTGYGVQTGLVLPRIAERYGAENVAGAVNFGLNGAAQTWRGMRMYPQGWTPYSDDVAPGHAYHFFDGDPHAGWVITLFDVWVLKNPAWQRLNVASWVPIDHTPAPPQVVEFFKRTGAVPIAMSRFGERMLAGVGLDPLYVPHGVDTTVYRPVERDRASWGIPDEAFCVGMVAANKGRPSRKSFGEAFLAFSRLKRARPDAVLYVHSEHSGITDGIDLELLTDMVGLSRDDVIFTDPYALRVGVPPERMAALYSNFDVLLSPSMGEGFGVPVIEAQACGVPVIVSDNTAQPELVGAGWTIPGQPWADMAQGAWFQIPSVSTIVDSLVECARRNDRKIDRDRERARDFALEYDVDHVWRTYWEPTLDVLADRLPTLEPIAAIPVSA